MVIASHQKLKSYEEKYHIVIDAYSISFRFV